MKNENYPENFEAFIDKFTTEQDCALNVAKTHLLQQEQFSKELKNH